MKVLVLLSLMFLTIVSYNAVMPVKGQAEAHDFRFRGSGAGQCLIAYGPPGAGFPDPVVWSGLGSGQTIATGYASDATAFPDSVPNVYISENIRANVEITIAWTEEDGSKHSIVARIYSTATSEALFYPSNNQFVLSIPMYSPPEKCMRFSGIYHVSGSESASISGVALFAAGIYGPSPWPDVITVLLGDEQSGTLFIVAWSRLGTPTPVPPWYLPAAKTYNTIVRET